MKFPKQFTSDLDEAYNYWCEIQATTQKPVIMGRDQWVMMLLKNTVYQLLGEKRTRAAEIDDA